MIGGTTFAIDESSPSSWLIFFVYLMAAWLCFRNARGSVAPASAGVRRVAEARSHKRFWTVLAGVLLLLGISRQFELQALAANVVRTVLLTDDVYGERSGLQIGLIAAIGGFGTIGLLSALFSVRRAESSVLAALVGADLLIVFTIIRTISLHDIDHFLASAPVPHLRLNDLIELVPLSLIALASFAFSRGLLSENEVARLRALSIKERRRMLGEKRRSARS